MFINGSSHDGVTTIERENPAHPQTIAGSVAAADTAIAAEAVEAAQRAFPSWANQSPTGRAAQLHEVADALRSSAGSIGETLATELGKPLAAAVGEANFAALYLDLVADRAPDLQEDDIVQNRFGVSVVAKRPYGAVTGIVPWNAPLILGMLKIAPALATGNTAVLKPSPLSPIAATQSISAMGELLPPGVINVVNGGADVGQVLTTHPAVRKVAFTGGLPTARAVMASAATGVKPVVLELGGNDPALVLDVPSLTDEQMTTLVQATFGTSGQVCIAIKRILVPADQVDQFADRFIQAASSALVLGDPLNPATTIGPVVTSAHADRVRGLVDQAVATGATAHRLGVDGERGQAGYYVEPTLIVGAGDSDSVVVDEQFGPTVPVLGFDSLDDAVARANDSDLGLAASVWTADHELAMRIARRLDVGTTFINSHNRFGINPGAPFGGTKLSGFGREYGDAGIETYLQTHAINTPASVPDGGYPTGAGTND